MLIVYMVCEVYNADDELVGEGSRCKWMVGSFYEPRGWQPRPSEGYWIIPGTRED